MNWNTNIPLFFYDDEKKIIGNFGGMDNLFNTFILFFFFQKTFIFYKMMKF